MQDQANTTDEMQALRDLLLKPLVDQNQLRDQKIMEFIEQFSTELSTRLTTLETQVSALGKKVDNRDNVVSDIGDGIASLGQQLRQLASRAEPDQQTPARPQAAKSAKA